MNLILIIYFILGLIGAILIYACNWNEAKEDPRYIIITIIIVTTLFGYFTFLTGLFELVKFCIGKTSKNKERLVKFCPDRFTCGLIGNSGNNKCKCTKGKL